LIIEVEVHVLEVTSTSTSTLVLVLVTTFHTAHYSSTATRVAQSYDLRKVMAYYSVQAKYTLLYSNLLYKRVYFAGTE
jgi:hypothetical protein